MFSCAARSRWVLAAGLFTFCESLLCREADLVRIHGINQCERLVLCTETCEAHSATPELCDETFLGWSTPLGMFT